MSPAALPAPSLAERTRSLCGNPPSWLLALSSGVLLSLAFPCHPAHPLAWIYHPVWAWIGAVPLLTALGRAAPIHSFRLGWITGSVFALLTLYWVAFTQGGGPAVVGGTGLLAMYVGLYVGLYAGMQRRLLRRWGTIALLAAPLLWTGQEYLLSLGELGFPWILLGHSQTAYPALIQYASWTGAYGVSAWIILLNALVALSLTATTRRRSRILYASAVPLLVGLTWLHGGHTMPPPAVSTSDVRVALVQPSLPLQAGWGTDGQERTLAQLEQLSREALAGSREPLDLVVWPETAVPCYLRWRQRCRTRIQTLADELDVAILTGASDYDPERRRPLNAAFLLRPGHPGMQHYAKMHLVPFGERTPFRDVIPLLRGIDWSVLTGDLGSAEFAPGRRRTVFTLPDVPLAVLICFEAVFPDFTRRSVRQGARMLVNITNDSWFGCTAGPYQHAQLVRLRAVENRVPIARCASSGISLFIDAYGRQLGSTDLGERTVRVGRLPLNASRTVYTRYGDWFAQTALALSFLLTLLASRGHASHRQGPAMTDHTSPAAHGTDDTTAAPAPGDETASAPENGDSETLPAHREMPFLDHLEELRWRILKSLGAVLVGAVICFVYSDTLMRVMTYPYQEAVLSLENRRSAGPVAAVGDLLRQWTGTAAATASPATEEVVELPPGRRLQSLKPMTYFFVNLQIALAGGFVLALPLVFYQIWQFVGPGLLRRERRLLVPIVLLSVVCFAVGALIAYWIVVPLGLRFFLALEPPDMTSQWAVDQYISFVMRLLLGFGLVFEMPVISFFLSRVGIITPAYLRRVRRYAMVAIFALAAVFTPPDPISQILMALPLLLLYEVSIWVSRASSRPHRL